MYALSGVAASAAAAEDAAARSSGAAAELSRARTSGLGRQEAALACSGATCLRAQDGTGLLEVCEGGDCLSVGGSASVSCTGEGVAWSAAGRRCVAVGETCEPPRAAPDGDTLAFVYDASGNCLATTDCKTGLVKHPEDQRCVKDCGDGRIFSYIMQSCVGKGEPCGGGPDARGVLQAFDAAGRCAPTGGCARDGAVFSGDAGRCVSEGDQCPGGARDAGGVCRRDGQACPETVHPDPGNPGHRSPPKSPADLGGASLEYSGGVCRPAAVSPCPGPGQEYSWRRGGCAAARDAPILCPPGFSRASETSCTRSQGVGGEGRGGVTVSGVDPSHRLRAVYRVVKEPRYSDADYNVSGPGIGGGGSRIRGSHSTGGGWVTGKDSYSYSYRNNDCQGYFTWYVEKR